MPPPRRRSRSVRPPWPGLIDRHARRQGSAHPGEARAPVGAAGPRGVPARPRRAVLAGRRCRALHLLCRGPGEEGDLGAGCAADHHRDPHAARSGPRGAVRPERRDDQRPGCVRRFALRSEGRHAHRVPHAERTRRPGVGEPGQARRGHPGAQQAQRHLRAPRSDAAGADRRDHRPCRRADHIGGMSGAPAERRGRERRTTGHRLEVILDVTRHLMSVTDLGSLLQLIAEATRELLAADRATIFIVDLDRGQLWSRVALGTDEIRIPLGTGIAGTVAQTGEVINIPDAYADPRFNPEPDQQSGYQTKSLLTYPMTGQEGRVIGVFQAVNKHGGGAFTSADEETLASLAASAAVAIENAQLVAEQRQLWQTLIETLAMTVDARDQQTAGHSL